MILDDLPSNLDMTLKKTLTSSEDLESDFDMN